MIEGSYIKKENRKKILLFCDDIRAHSGIGHMGREMVTKTCHHYNWVNIGGSVNHPEAGQKLDVSGDTNKKAGIEDSSVIIYPTSGYGTPELLRVMLKTEKPDAIFIITDPRYWLWLFDMEAEIRKHIPIIYLNIWDNYPAPMYNKTFYESCDALLGISKQTVNINRLVLGDKGDSKVIEYVPHGVDEKDFRPLTSLEKTGDKYTSFINRCKQGKDIDFTILFNSRNIRRKQIPDTILAFKHFVDGLPVGQKEKAMLLLHTQAVDPNGTDLPAVIELLTPEDQGYNVHLTDRPLEVEEMNFLYNLADSVVLLSSNEGWGLALTESLLSGTPFVANVTGGMQDQMRFVKDGKWAELDADFPSNHNKTLTECGEWVFPVYPTSISMVGSPATPYIWDDRCDPVHVADRFREIYELTPDQRVSRGLKGREWATGTEAGFTSELMGQRIIKSVDRLFDEWKPREGFELILAGELEKKVVPHKLVY